MAGGIGGDGGSQIVATAETGMRNPFFISLASLAPPSLLSDYRS
jgi:hypothetical protein